MLVSSFKRRSSDDGVLEDLTEGSSKRRSSDGVFVDFDDLDDDGALVDLAVSSKRRLLLEDLEDLEDLVDDAVDDAVDTDSTVAVPYS